MARQLQVSFADEARVRVGIAAHSLRAATIEQLRDVISTMSAITPQSPIHLHIAEQPAEVDDCLATFGQRPVEYLASHFSLDSRWNLVHATHITPQERQLLATSSVNIILCPMTEANLGDGFFPAVDFLREDGRFAIGSDSHISVSPWEELRMLEYGQRLVHQQRNLLCREGFSTGTTLLQEVVATGNRVIGNEIAGITTGAFADFISLNTDHPQLAGRHHETLIDTLVFAGDASYLCDVFVGGRRIIANSSHPDQEHAAAAYRECVSGIVGTMQNH
jgi:formimidoylglutamate deiminase